MWYAKRLALAASIDDWFIASLWSICGEYFRLYRLLPLDADPVDGLIKGVFFVVIMKKNDFQWAILTKHKLFRQISIILSICMNKWSGIACYLPIIQSVVPLECCLFFVTLHVRCKCGRCIVASIANRALERFLIVMRFHVDFQMIAADLIDTIESFNKFTVSLFLQWCATTIKYNDS